MPETTFESTFALDTAHPNFERWQRAIDHARLRGDAVCDALEQHMALNGAVVLDAGCGVGGTSAALIAHGADVIAVDRNPDRLAALNKSLPEVETDLADLTSLPYPDASFDAIILQDVLEHLESPADALVEMARVLTADGLLYLSTPNRSALINIVSDPHFGLPFVSLKRRSQLRAILLRKRPADAGRDDLAQLLSFQELTGLLQFSRLRPTFINRATARRLFDQPESLVWTDAHLRAIRMLQKSGLTKLALRFVSDKPGLFNTWINPAWYAICRKDM